MLVFGIIAPIEPFQTVNRFSTAAVFGILAYEVLNIFEEVFFGTGRQTQHGVLVELMMRIAMVVFVG